MMLLLLCMIQLVVGVCTAELMGLGIGFRQ